MTACPACGAAGQPDAARFCFACGAILAAATCGACHAEVVPGARFCSGCGARQASGTAAPTTATTQVASRRMTSVLFGDLVGFTGLSESRDAEEVRELLSRYFEGCQRVIARYGGVVEKFIGDAVMAVWGVPIAHEDDAERAVRAGLELVNALVVMGVEVGVPELEMRVGIVTGEVAVTIGAQQQGMVAGDAVNTASRVQSVAVPGQVWVDETTRLLTSSAISYVDVGSHRLKGKVDPVPLWSVRTVVAGVGGVQRADGLEAPLVGRDRELRMIKELFHGAEESEQPALLIVSGEPGVGKSRLAWEFEKYVDGLSTSVRWHSGRCVAYGEGVAFFALAEAIRARLSTLRPDDADEDPATMLGAGLDRYVTDSEERSWLEPRLGVLLGIGSAGTFPREDLFASWTAFLRRVGEDAHAVVLVIDDAQHADDGLVAFLEHLLAAASFPCLVVLLARPSLLEGYPGLATNHRATVVHVEPLGDRDMSGLLDGLVAGLPPAVRAALVERADGIPLYAVETVRSLIDRGLVMLRDGEYVLADPESLDLASVGAPASLQALIAARLDTLSTDERRVVDQASVVGSSFALEELADLCVDVPDLDGVVAGLVRLQVFRQELNRFSNEHGQFQFVQSAVRQVAYGSLSRRDRKASHLAVADQVGSVDDAVGELAPIIAQHYLAALDAVPEDADHDELTERAIRQLTRAASRARSLGAPAEAAAHLGVALERAADAHQHATIGRDLALALVDSGRYGEARPYAESALADFERLGDDVAAGSAAAVLAAVVSLGAGDNEEAVRIAEPHYERLKGREDALRVLLDLSGVMASSMIRISMDIREIVDERVLLAEQAGDEAAIAESCNSLATQYMHVGSRAMGRMLQEDAAAISRRHHDTPSLARSLSNLTADWNGDDAVKATELGREAVDVAKSTGVQLWMSVSQANLILALLATGEWTDAIDLMDSQALVEEVSVVAVEYGRALVARARGEAHLLSWDSNAPPRQDDAAYLAWRAMAESVCALDRGDAPTAVQRAIDGLEHAHTQSGVYDDFHVFWPRAVEAALVAGDDTALDRMTELVDGNLFATLPTSLQGHRRHLAAQVGIRQESDPAEIEKAFRDALTAYDAWHGVVEGARCRADFGGWLNAQGRSEEARPLLQSAREVYASIGATKWLADLEPATAG
ncbi:adenylate/guanylate cyclase domain-containing protein [Leekyejoonella antrihumi]|uniref:Guanylate cyclase domain-containing protein n=1 Tax=Leekyejoonella antrihumi TaxID=1660198 RepID=A0A563E3Y6_9MICO|nr:adenylate/guanylate cyclase domain-containing protein [Leekyejoonella antrihumi]TWP36921.1 hypothetical protein FGL98_07590 [Leekyejoonella antrihumi]